MRVDESQGVRVALTARRDVRLEHHRSASDMHHRERVRVAVRVNADYVVQLSCKHPH
jgi:hypothetical protein